MLVLYAVSRAAWIEPFRGDFVERNPSYSRHIAAGIPIDKEDGSPAIDLPAGTVVTAPDGVSGQPAGARRAARRQSHGHLLGHLGLARQAGRRGTCGPEKARLAGRSPKSKASPTRASPISAPGSTRWYGSDLPKPPGYVSTSQWISIFVVIAGVGIFLLGRKLNEPGFTTAAEAYVPPETEDDA